MNDNTHVWSHRLNLMNQFVFSISECNDIFMLCLLAFGVSTSIVSLSKLQQVNATWSTNVVNVHLKFPCWYSESTSITIAYHTTWWTKWMSLYIKTVCYSSFKHDRRSIQYIGHIIIISSKKCVSIPNLVFIQTLRCTIALKT